MVTLFRQPAELPPVHRRQQSAVCESCQSINVRFFELFIIQEILKRLQGLVTFKYVGSL